MKCLLKVGLACIAGVAWGLHAEDRFLNSNISANPDVLKLWDGTPPGEWKTPHPEARKTFPMANSQPSLDAVFNVSQPDVTVIKPTKGRSNGAAMVVLPGGGFMMLSISLEGYNVGKWLADQGITAFVVKYRVKDQKIPYDNFIKDPTPYSIAFDKYLDAIEPALAVSTDDALQAMRVVRNNAEKYHIDSNKVGMIGFSAGAITTIRALEVSDESTRPNFAASLYGASLKSPDAPKNIPLFIGHAQDDPAVPVEKSLQIFEAWKRVKAPVEMHIYENGGHGFGLGTPGTSTAEWTEDFKKWLVLHHITTQR